jgi:hypothetical protein
LRFQEREIDDGDFGKVTLYSELQAGITFGDKKWLSKIGLADKWRTCSDGRQKRPQKESSNEKAQKEPHGSIQGEGSGRCIERRQDVG